MELEDLGFDSWFQEKYEGIEHTGFGAARLTRVDRDRYLVRNEHDEVQAESTGRLVFSAESSLDLPCVGDWVIVQYHNEGTLAIIHDVLPRRTFLRRKSAGNSIEYQLIAANVDVAFIMQSCDVDFNLRRMERYLVMVNEGHVEPIILLSKCDLVSHQDVERRMGEIRRAEIGAKVIALSNTTEFGLITVRQALQQRKTYCLIGSSGVGKTTLLNHLLGRAAFDTKPVREGDGRGMHTTSRRQLAVLESGALLVDTPGMRELGMMAVSDSIDDSFSDIHELASHCRFNDCTHAVETGCGILGAVESGVVSRERYESYMKLMKESAFHEMSYLERRSKDRQFGRMIKTAKQQLKKRKPPS